MSVRTTSLDPVETRLEKGIHIIEASAGTGKTYTLAMLVLRLISENDIPVESILLVTFTRAATEELAERIRSRLSGAKHFLEQQGKYEPDASLRQWADKLDDKEKAVQRINRALLDLDRAAIYTIHGFSQRVLLEHAMECGLPYEMELVPDVSDYTVAATHDFWRHYMYTLPKIHCGVILSEYPSPRKLQESLPASVQYITEISPLVDSLHESGTEFVRRCETLKKWWSESGSMLHDRLADCMTAGVMKKQFCENFSQWWKKLADYFTGHSDLYPKEIEMITADGFLSQINGNKVRGKKRQELLQQVDLPSESINRLISARNTVLLSLRTEFTWYLQKKVAYYLKKNRLLSYDDLIEKLYSAVSSDNGRFLITELRKKYCAALIDEFQDTDSKQWNIFQTIFGAKSHYLYLIGDPKQAIYRFRGADIQSYFSARRASDSVLTLQKNYRAHPHMVEAVNTLFTSRKHPFVYDEEILPFNPVLPAKKCDDLSLTYDGKSREGMVYCQLSANTLSRDGRWGVIECSEQIRHAVTNEILKLLSNGTIIQNQSEIRTVRPSDIAILVRNNEHARFFQRYIQKNGVPCIVSAKDSVFESVEASEICTVLEALCNITDTSLFKRSMVLSWFGRSGQELQIIWENEKQFEKFYLRFTGYYQLWENNGFLIMMKELLQRENVYCNLAEKEGAERKIANIEHLLEILQVAEVENMYGPARLLRYLQKQIEQNTLEHELRLEQDEDALHIVTMHGAKGLEYPIVFCPYLWYRQQRMKKETRFVLENTPHGVRMDLGSETFEVKLSQSDHEEMAEELRLLYVAITRAQLRCYFVWCDIASRGKGPTSSFNSAAGYLLFPTGTVDYKKQKEGISKIAEPDHSHYMEMATGDEIGKYYSLLVSHSQFSLPERTRKTFSTDWQLTSYSALASVTSNPGMNNSFALEEDVHNTVLYSTLPSGARFGNVVHEVMEKISFQDIATHDLQEHLTIICDKYRVEADVCLLEKLVKNVVQTPLFANQLNDDAIFCLKDIEEGDCLKEMAFNYRLHKTSTAVINRLLDHDTIYRSISEFSLQGYLSGFVDLIFTYNNKIYIVDYKSNNLGESAERYAKEKLPAVMAEHNYGLQSWLYSLVVHDYLTQFQSGYSYENNFGGVLYLFVRGMNQHGRAIYFHKPDESTLVKLSKCFRGEHVRRS